ncbi:DUF6783 domain-containing protein, partial [Robinsoniella peoriensis]|uniref:DUF6783 domain-containing protein n=1 Tax=Robinsoniella peoriensis TaxID=180332 RepID=UPI003750B61D
TNCDAQLPESNFKTRSRASLRKRREALVFLLRIFRILRAQALHFSPGSYGYSRNLPR